MFLKIPECQPMTDSPLRCYRFAGYRLDTVTREITAPHGTTVALKARTFDVLRYLIEHRERVVGKDELLAAVWPGRIVEENNLGQAVSALRRVLGTGAGDHQYIVTVSGHGYRFVATLDETEGALPGLDEHGLRSLATEADPVPARHHMAWSLAGATALAVVLLTTARLWEPTSTPLPAAAPGPAAPSPILAVLPFKTIGEPGAKQDAVLGLGMAETLISRLSQATSLRVLSLGSVHRFVDVEVDVDPMQAGKRLGAGYIVDGSTQAYGHLIRVNARLVSLPEGRTVWAGTFDETPDRVFTLQDVIAQRVTEAMSLRYAGGKGHRSPCDGGDAHAYRAYLSGRHLMYRPNRLSLPKAIVSFREAIDSDPLCARAWAGLAFAYRAQAIAADHDPRDVFPKAKAAVASALAIDPQSAEAYASKGMIEFWYDWDWGAAEASLRHAIALDGNLAEAHFALAHLLNNLRRHDEAERHARNATTLDPLSPVINSVVASFYINTSKFAEANRKLDNVLELDPDFWVALYMRGVIAWAQDDIPAAMTHLRQAERSCGGCSQAQSMLVLVLVRANQRAAAEQLLAGMEVRAHKVYMPATRLALAHQALGHESLALDLLERAYDERDMYLSFLLVDPRWRQLQREPRFGALVRRMNLDTPIEDRTTGG